MKTIMKNEDPHQGLIHGFVRKSLRLSLLLLAAGLISHVSGQDAEKRETLYQESLRPQFHFTARYWDEYSLHPGPHHEGWMNDMNGLVYNDGEYHFFAQRWWSAWLHAISTDLIHWQELHPAFGKGGKFGGTQSGGGVVDHANSSGLGDGVTPPMVAFWSSTDNKNQCISYSRDKGRTWAKYDKNPVLAHPFRDPNVFWYAPGKKWVMILYGPENELSQATAAYGFNGESNDAHDLRECVVGQWKSSVLRVFPDGKVVVSDQDGQSEASIDAKLANVGIGGFHIGVKADGSEFLDGDIAEILVYDRPLTDEETGSVIRDSAAAPAEGMVLHLDAANIGEGVVGQWKDLSGKGNDMKQADPARMPTCVNDGKPLIRFSGKQSLSGPAVLAEGDDSFTIAARWRRRQADGSQVVCEQNSAEKSNGRRAALLTVRNRGRKNCYLLFSSKNLLDWEKLPGSIPDSFECPDMFELPVDGNATTKKWVVVDGKGDYVIGSFDGTSFTTEAKKRKGDFGKNFYATMTFDNMPASDLRRVQMAWMKGYDDYPKEMPFNQQASFPCELTLRTLPEGVVLCRYPIQGIETLAGKRLHVENFKLTSDNNPLSRFEGELLDLKVVIDTARSNCEKVTLVLHGNTVSYDLKKHILTSHGSEAPLAPRSDLVEIRILMDRLSLETFGNRGEVSITNVAHQDTSNKLEISATGGDAAIRSLNVSELKSIWK